ncbi:glycoside hydrolase family 2 TIM barrel-domain containing protein [Zobellia laminariae]|uniref:glycoside hydrolase family 2 TIM barrel-domain containing protein n=1 Tax=Zobellia laminariae TaxID=248906 RepID=UPI0026F42B0A|nr:glycoside hydrolase family 2 TIM barrel-domain containing protein [Zobellia laminariae]WKX76601.1 glycoside hydrolase family 2 TIM barrel-domain containing protein [Zobellia laminariae]
MMLRKSFLFILLLQFSFSFGQLSSEATNGDVSFNGDWLFQKGDPSGAEKSTFKDADWRKLNLPHDWAIEGPFDKKYNARTGGLPVHGTAWYRKHFTIDKKYAAQQIAVLFDGVMNNSKVYINGTYIGERPFGYMGFELDLTPYIKFGEDNVIAVRVAPEDLASRWYSGTGIYRNTYLKINNPIHIPLWGTYITTPEVSDERATVKIETTVKNAVGKGASVTLETKIIDGLNNVVASSSQKIGLEKSSEKVVIDEIVVNNPNRWGIENPYLYDVVTQVKKGNTILDEYSSTLGIRSISFDAKEGFLLNEEPVEFKGVCMHHDLGPLGGTVNYRATKRQMQIMQSMGVNALRTSHNPPSPEMLQICDKLGIVVLDEAFDEWKIPKVINGYNKFFDEWHERDLRDMIKRDRNHPSVVMWSIGNEIIEQRKKDGWKVAKMLSDICHDEDHTRPTTAGFNNYPGAFKNKLAYQIDIVGLNYKPFDYGEVIRENPDMIVYGSETSSQTSSRGTYALPITHDHKKETLEVSSYDVTVGPPWAYPPDVEFDVQAENPTFLGEFMWTGFDYLGEPTPYGGRDNSTDGYWNADWPVHASYFAPVDLCGFPKDRYYLYQSQWTTEPMVHVLPHWNWEGKEGEEIPVYAYTNCDEVELIVNGKSMGKKIKGVDTTDIPAEFRGFEKGMYTSKYRLSWKVPYQPGSLRVIGYKDGKAVAEKIINTAKKASKIRLTADRTEITADGKDLSFIEVDITDADGNLIPNADNQVQFTIEGAGILAAVGNGNPASLESFQDAKIKAFNGKCLLVVKSTEAAGNITVSATSNGLESTKTIVKTK